MNSDDLTSLFATPPGTDQEFVKGSIQAWNVASGANTILARGAVLTNVPFFSLGSLVDLQPGDAVMLLRLRTSWFLIGRVVTAGAAVLNSAAALTQHGQNQSSNFAPTTSFTTQGTASFTTPAWANRALIFGTGLVTAGNSTATSDMLRVILDIDGTGGGEALQEILNGKIGAVTVTNSRLMAVTAAQVITLNVRVRTNAAGWAASVNNVGTLNCFAVFTKV